MKFKVWHHQKKPINIIHRQQRLEDWKNFCEELLKEKPTNEEGWKEVSLKMDEKEKELDEQYPITEDWEINSIGDLVDKVEEFGSLVVCKENNLTTLYLYDKIEEEEKPSQDLQNDTNDEETGS